MTSFSNILLFVSIDPPGAVALKSPCFIFLFCNNGISNNSVIISLALNELDCNVLNTGVQGPSSPNFFK